MMNNAAKPLQNVLNISKNRIKMKKLFVDMPIFIWELNMNTHKQKFNYDLTVSLKVQLVQHLNDTYDDSLY